MSKNIYIGNNGEVIKLVQDLSPENHPKEGLHDLLAEEGIPICKTKYGVAIGEGKCIYEKILAHIKNDATTEEIEHVITVFEHYINGDVYRLEMYYKDFIFYESHFWFNDCPSKPIFTNMWFSRFFGGAFTFQRLRQDRGFKLSDVKEELSKKVMEYLHEIAINQGCTQKQFNEGNCYFVPTIDEDGMVLNLKIGGALK